MNDRISQALEALSLPKLGKRLGLILAKSCHCPWREDTNPSFSVWHNGKKWMWKDHATGESGDTIAFIAKLNDISMSAAATWFCCEALGHVEPQWFGPFHKGRDTDFRELAALRSLSVAGVRLASSLGNLLFGDAYGHPCWVVTGRNIKEARRMDGLRFFDKHKSMAGKNCSKSFPVGLTDECHDRVLFCEGGADFLSGYHFTDLIGLNSSVTPIAMLGRSVKTIHDDAVEILKGKEIIFAPHNDEDGGGAAAMECWSDQLEGDHSFISFVGLNLPESKPVSDLNDYALIADEAMASTIFS